MAELVEIIREDVGKTSYAMRYFFQKMIDKGELKAYSVEINKRIVEKDTDDEEIVRTKKGVTLTPTERLREYQSVFIEDSETGTLYNLDIGSRGGMIYDDGDSQTIYHHCVLEMLAKKFDSKKIMKKGLGIWGSFDNGLSIPDEMIKGRLKVSYDEDWESGVNFDEIAGTTGDLVIEGKKDKLFEKVYDFVMGTD